MNPKLKVAVLSNVQIGDLLVRRSIAVDIPVVVTDIEGDVLTVQLRPEQLLPNAEAMTRGMMELGAEGSPVQLIKGVAWKYDIKGGDEIDPSILGQSVLLKPE